MRASLGDRLVLFELAVSYVFPLLFYSIYSDLGYGYFVNKEPYSITVLYIILTTLCYWLISRLRLVDGFVNLVFIALLMIKRVIQINPKMVLLIISLVYLAASVIFFFSGFARYRYDGVDISEQLGLVLFAVLFFKSLVFGLFFTIPFVGFRFVRQIRWHLCLLNIANFLSVDGTMGLLSACICFALTVSKFYTTSHSLSGLMKRSALYFCFVFIIPLLWVFGEGVKRGDSSYVISVLADPVSLVPQLLWLIERLSTLYFSLNNVLLSFFNQTGQNIFPSVAYDIIFDSNYYRLCILTGYECLKPEFSQVSHYNYFLITEYSPLSNAGASPGILASSAYLMGFLGFILSAIFLVVFSGFVDKLSAYFGGARKINILGLIALLTLSRGIILNPIDLLVIGKGVLLLVGFAVGISLVFALSYKNGNSDA